MKISIVLLTKNGGDVLQEAVLALKQQQMEYIIELIAVDSSSTDGTKEYLKKAGFKLYSVKANQFRFGPIREYGFALSSGDIIVTQSQDVVPMSRSYISELINPIIMGEVDVVQGKTKIPNCQDNYFVWHCDPKVFYFTNEASDFTRKAGGIELSCECIAMSRRAWQNTGFDDSPYCEDKYIQVDLLRKAYRVRELEEPIAWHGHQYDFVSLIERCYNEGVGWRYAGAKYTIFRLVYDLTIGFLKNYRKLLNAIAKRRAKTIASLFFFQIRPISVFIGNRITQKLWS